MGPIFPVCATFYTGMLAGVKVKDEELSIVTVDR